MVSHPLRMRKALGSNPSGSIVCKRKRKSGRENERKKESKGTRKEHEKRNPGGSHLSRLQKSSHLKYTAPRQKHYHCACCPVVSLPAIAAARPPLAFHIFHDRTRTDAILVFKKTTTRQHRTRNSKYNSLDHPDWNR